MAPPKTRKYPINYIQCQKCFQRFMLNSQKRLDKLINNPVDIFHNGGGGSEDVLRERYYCRRCRPRRISQKDKILIKYADGEITTNYDKYLKTDGNDIMH